MSAKLPTRNCTHLRPLTYLSIIFTINFYQFSFFSRLSFSPFLLLFLSFSEKTLLLVNSINYGKFLPWLCGKWSQWPMGYQDPRKHWHHYFQWRFRLLRQHVLHCKLRSYWQTNRVNLFLKKWFPRSFCFIWI